MFKRTTRITNKMDHMKMLQKVMEKKKDGQDLDPTYVKAKMSMLGHLRDEMHNMMADDLHSGPAKHVEVAADDEAGLKHGLDKAKELLGAGDEPADEDKDADGDYDHEESIADHADSMGGNVAHESDEGHDANDTEYKEHEASEDDGDESDESLMQKIEALKKKMKKK